MARTRSRAQPWAGVDRANACEICEEPLGEHPFLCDRHWNLVPRTTQIRVYLAAQPGGRGFLAAKDASLAAVKQASARCSICDRIVGWKNGFLKRHPAGIDETNRLIECAGGGTPAIPLSL